MKKPQRGLGFWGPAALLLISLGVLALARALPAASEWYAEQIYPLLVRTVGRLSGLLPFSLAEWVIYALAYCAILWLIRLLSLTVRRKWKGLKRRFFSGLRKLFWTASVIFCLYTFQCGINYYRTPFSAFSGLTVRPSTAEELAALTVELAEEANRLAPSALPPPKGRQSSAFPSGRLRSSAFRPCSCSRRNTPRSPATTRPPSRCSSRAGSPGST